MIRMYSSDKSYPITSATQFIAVYNEGTRSFRKLGLSAFLGRIEWTAHVGADDMSRGNIRLSTGYACGKNVGRDGQGYSSSDMGLAMPRVMDFTENYLHVFSAMSDIASRIRMPFPQGYQSSARYHRFAGNPAVFPKIHNLFEGLTDSEIQLRMNPSTLSFPALIPHRDTQNCPEITGILVVKMTVQRMDSTTAVKTFIAYQRRSAFEAMNRLEKVGPVVQSTVDYYNSLSPGKRLASVDDIPAYYSECGEEGMIASFDKDGKLVAAGRRSRPSMNKLSTYESSFADAFFLFVSAGLIRMTLRWSIELILPVVCMNNNYAYPVVIRKWVREGKLPQRDPEDNLWTLYIKEVLHLFGGLSKQPCKRHQPFANGGFNQKQVREMLHTVREVVIEAKRIRYIQGTETHPQRPPPELQLPPLQSACVSQVLVINGCI